MITPLTLLNILLLIASISLVFLSALLVRAFRDSGSARLVHGRIAAMESLLERQERPLREETDGHV